MNRRRAYDSRVLGGSPDRAPVVVDDASPDGVGAVASAIGDPRAIVVSHDRNRGVGGAKKTGFERALQLGADIVVKLDIDGQMGLALIPEFVAPPGEGRADHAKGNRAVVLDVQNEPCRPER